MYLLLGIAFIYLLSFPAQAAEGARQGLLLWYRSVLPILFPFMLLCNMGLKTGLFQHLPHAVFRPLQLIFGCSFYGAVNIFLGFLCGFPMGAKITSDLYHQKRITSQEARWLYGFSNNLSPAFILSYLGVNQMRPSGLGGIFLLNILGASVLYGLITSIPVRKKENLSSQETDLISVSLRKDIFSLLDECINDSVYNIVKLGVYIMIFSIFSQAVTGIIPARNIPLLILASVIEVTKGISMICSHIGSFCIRYAAASALCSFGGLSALAQTVSIASMEPAHIRYYIKSRVIITLLCVLLSLFYLLLISIFRFF